MAQSNQPMQPSHQSGNQASPAKASDRVKVRVKTGRVLISHGSGESDADTFAEAGHVFEMSRGAFEAHLKSRTFDSYGLPNGEMADRPRSVCDATLELVTDQVA